MTTQYRSVGCLSDELDYSQTEQAMAAVVADTQAGLKGDLDPHHAISQRGRNAVVALAYDWRGEGSETKERAEAGIGLAARIWMEVAAAGPRAAGFQQRWMSDVKSLPHRMIAELFSDLLEGIESTKGSPSVETVQRPSHDNDSDTMATRGHDPQRTTVDGGKVTLRQTKAAIRRGLPQAGTRSCSQCATVPC